MTIETRQVLNYEDFRAVAQAIFKANVGGREYSYVRGPRHWHAQLQERFPLHPVVVHALKSETSTPADWMQLVLEWPHVSETDETRLAYTRNERDGGSDKQTITSIGKYLSRHWPHVGDHIRRDWAGVHTTDTFHWSKTTPEIIAQLELGPRSCMQSSYGTIPFRERDVQMMDAWRADNTQPEPDWDRHPYAAYAPQYGWKLATRRKGNSVDGRALTLDREHGKLYVRTYSRPADEGSYSGSDHKLEAWLEAQGYEKKRQWPQGAKLARLTHPTKDGILAPYLDAGDSEDSRVADEVDHIALDREGEYECRNTDGTVDYVERAGSVGHCGECHAEVLEGDDYTYVDRDDATLVCSCCAEGFTRVHGQGWSGPRQYYIPSGDAICVYGEYYDPDHIPDGAEIVQLEDGGWASYDDVARIDGRYYDIDDPEVLVVEEECTDEGHCYALRGDCWEDFEGRWHRDDIDYEMHGGAKYTLDQYEALGLEDEDATQVGTVAAPVTAQDIAAALVDPGQCRFMLAA